MNSLCLIFSNLVFDSGVGRLQTIMVFTQEPKAFVIEAYFSESAYVNENTALTLDFRQQVFDVDFWEVDFYNMVRNTVQKTVSLKNIQGN